MIKEPSNEVFLEMREIATKIWKKYSDEYGYVTEKLDRINSFENIQDNALIFYQMFDFQNQSAFRTLASAAVLNYISTYLSSGQNIIGGNHGLIGKSAVGFKFESAQQLYYNSLMEKYNGVSGTIVDYDEDEDAYCICFEDGTWWNYPAKEIVSQVLKPVYI